MKLIGLRNDSDFILLCSVCIRVHVYISDI